MTCPILGRLDSHTNWIKFWGAGYPHIYAKSGRYTVAVKVIDIFGNDTMTLLPVDISGEG